MILLLCSVLSLFCVFFFRKLRLPCFAYLSSANEQKTQELEATVLPNDVLSRVLVRLPLETLMRIKGVCKSWNSLISSPDFHNAHLDYAGRTGSNYLYLAETPGLTRLHLLRDDDSLTQFASLELPMQHLWEQSRAQRRVIGCVKGLVCFSFYSPSSSPHGMLSPLPEIFLYNPLTQKSLKVPLRIDHTHVDISYPEFGFGYDSVTRDFKVVKISMVLPYQGLELVHVMFEQEQRELRQPVQTPLFKVHVYSLHENAWETLDVNVPPVNLTLRKYVYVNGNCHWFSHSCDGIVALDVVTNQCRLIKLPNDHMRVDASDLLAASGDCLVLVKTTVAPEFKVWILNEHGDDRSWSNLCTVEYVNGSGYFRGFRHNGELLMVNRRGNLVSSRRDATVRVNTQIDWVSGSSTVLPYEESLALGIPLKASVPSMGVAGFWSPTRRRLEGRDRDLPLELAGEVAGVLAGELKITYH